MEMAPDNSDAVHTEGGENTVQKRRGGAPIGNQNRLTHGLRTKRSGGFLLGALPANCRHIKRATDVLRRCLETAVTETRGVVTLTDEATIQTAARAERHSLYCGKMLAEADGSLKPEIRMKLSAEVVRGSEARDKAIRELRLDSNSRTAVFAAIQRAHNDADGESGESVVLVGEIAGAGHGGDVAQAAGQVAAMAEAMAGATRARRERKNPGATEGGSGEGNRATGEGLTVAGSTEAVSPVAVIPVEAVHVPAVATMTEGTGQDEAEKTRVLDRPETSISAGPETAPPATSPTATKADTDTETEADGWLTGWAPPSIDQDDRGEAEENSDRDDRPGNAAGEAVQQPGEASRVDRVAGWPVAGGFDWSLGATTGAGSPAGSKPATARSESKPGTSNTSNTSGNGTPKRKGQG